MYTNVYIKENGVFSLGCQFGAHIDDESSPRYKLHLLSALFGFCLYCSLLKFWMRYADFTRCIFNYNLLHLMHSIAISLFLSLALFLSFFLSTFFMISCCCYGFLCSTGELPWLCMCRCVFVKTLCFIFNPSKKQENKQNKLYVMNKSKFFMLRTNDQIAHTSMRILLFVDRCSIITFKTPKLLFDNRFARLHK